MSNFYGRPYQVLFAERIVENLKTAIKDSSIKNVNLVLVGVEQITDGVDMIELKKFLQKIGAFLNKL